MRSLNAKSVLILAALIFCGCSSGRFNPVTPSESIPNPINPISNTNIDTSNHQLLGTWEIIFDANLLTAAINPVRESNTHYNATNMIPHPTIVVNSYDHATNVIDVDVTLENPFNADAYDVRGIIFTDGALHQLLNPDEWTPLYDIPGGLDVNPFKAYAKSIPNRKFGAHTQHTENFQIYLHQGDTHVKYAVDASYPGNCNEPYAFDNLTQGSIKDSVGSSTTVGVDVFDWQDNVSEVWLECPEITGQNLVAFHAASGNRWELELVNNTGTHYGEYPAWVIAYSSNSGTLALYRMVVITVDPEFAPSNPRITGSVFFYQDCKDICINGNIAYVADDINGLKIIDISNPSSPTLISSLLFDKGTGYGATRVVYQNGIAYVDYWRGGVWIVDVSYPQNPRLIGHYGTPGDATQDIAVSGDKMYAIIEGHLDIIDISNPGQPQHLAFSNLQYEITNLMVKGNYIYATTPLWSAPTTYLLSIDVSDPQAPFQGGIVPVSDRTLEDFAIGSNISYIATNDAGIKLVDISDPLNMRILGEIGYFDRLFGIGFSDNHIYVGGVNGLWVYDVSDPSNPMLENHTQFSSTGSDMGIAFSGSYCFYARGTIGVKVFDIKDPAQPSLLSSFGENVSPVEIKKRDDYAYVLSNALLFAPGKILTIDVKNTAAPQVVSSLPLGNEIASISDLEFKGDYGYCTWYIYIPGHPPEITGYFDVIDFSDPLFPQDIDSEEIFMNSDDTEGDTPIEIHNNLLYYLLSNALMIMDISDPANPQDFSYLSLNISPVYVDNLIAIGNYVYIQTSGDIYIVDVNDPLNPQIVNTIAFTPKYMTTYDNYMVAANSGGTIKLFDVDNPATPVEISSYESGFTIYDIQAADKFVYVSDYQYGLRILDYRDPLNPSQFRSLEIQGGSSMIALNGNYIYSSNGSFSLEVISLR